MNKISLKLNTVVFLLAITLGCEYAYAGYDVIKANTLKDNSSTKEKKEQFEQEYIQSPDALDLPDFKEEKTLASYIKNKKDKLFKRKRKNEITEEQGEEVLNDNKNQETIKVEDKNKFHINADKISYDDTDGNVYATGHVEIIAPVQNVTLKANEATLEKSSQLIKLKGNVSILKDGVEMKGETLLVDLNEENLIMDNPTAEAYSFIINAQESYIIANNLQMVNGTVSSNTKKQIAVVPKRFYRYTPYDAEQLYDPELRDDLDIGNKKKKYRVDSKEIIVTCYKDHNSLVLKDSKLYYNNHKVTTKSDIEIISDKDIQYVETNMAEVGTFKAFGTYAGYGFVHRLPKGQMLKVMPAVVYGEGRLGVGLLGRHRTRNSLIEAGYSTSTERPVLKGLYKIGNGFTLRYGRNAYIPEGFMGARRSGYAGQLAFEKAYTDIDTNITFRHGTYAGIFSDYKKKNGDHYFATTRFRENFELTKRFLEYRNPEQDLKIRFSVNAQASATLYGTGDTTGVIRVGPMLSSKLKKWESAIAYYQGGIHGDSPFIFDKYRYGRSTISFNEKFNFNNKFALGYAGAISPNKDNYDRDLLTESCFYALFGPQDFKLVVSYDFIREIGHLDFMFVLGSDSTKINFEKLTTENIDRAKQKQDFYKKTKRIKVEDI